MLCIQPNVALGGCLRGSWEWSFRCVRIAPAREVTIAADEPRPVLCTSAIVVLRCAKGAGLDDVVA